MTEKGNEEKAGQQGTTEKVNGFERIVRFLPAFDRRNPNPSKNYGIHGVTLQFFLKGPKGTIQFVVFTNWQLPHVEKEHDARCDGSYCFRKPMAADIGYHSPVPLYEGQEPITDKCEWTGGVCYYDGSTLCAEPIFERLLREGDDGVWAALEEWYHSRFEEKEAPTNA